jgi:tetratricopeptide (TPR) repeat protein
MEARDTLLYSLEHDSSVAARRLSLAGLYRETELDDEAESAFLKVVALDPTSHDAWVGLGILYFQRRRFPQAVDALRHGIQLGSQNVAVHACLGEALYLQGDISGAAEAHVKQIQVGASEPKIIQKFASRDHGLYLARLRTLRPSPGLRPSNLPGPIFCRKGSFRANSARCEGACGWNDVYPAERAGAMTSPAPV